MKWISVNDELPPKDFIVLLCYEEPLFGVMCKDIDTGCLATDECEEGEFVFCNNISDLHKKANRVTHWMHLPEPPTQ